MARLLRDKMKSAGSKRSKKIEVRAQQLVAEEMAMRELRKAPHRSSGTVNTEERIETDAGVINVIPAWLWSVRQ